MKHADAEANGVTEIAPNPLLAALPPEMSKAQLRVWLTSSPQLTPPAAPSEVKSWIEAVLVLTDQLLTIAHSLLLMMREAAHAQDVRKLKNRMAAFTADALLQPRTTAGSGLIVEGPTAGGKSFIVEQILKRVTQVIEHGPIREAGILSLRQLVHLTIPLSGDGTPKAFFLNALLTVDTILGTDYHGHALKAYRNSGSATISAFLMHKLKQHRTLALVLEEGQEKNLGNKGFLDIIETLILQVLNYGIPVVLIGNPDGFKLLLKRSQVLRRASMNGRFRLDPSLTWEDPSWEALMHGLWLRTPLDRDDEVWCSADRLSHLLWRATGGFPGFLALLRQLCVRNALDRGDVCVTREDLLSALTSEQYKGSAHIAEPFATRNPALLIERFEDCDPNYYVQLWQKLAAKEAVTQRRNATANAVSNGIAPSEHVEASDDAIKEGTVKAAVTKKAGAAMPIRKERSAPSSGMPRDGAPTKDLSPDDVRSDGWVANQPKRLDE